MENKVLNKMKSDTNIDVTKQEVKIAEDLICEYEPKKERFIVTKDFYQEIEDFVTLNGKITPMNFKKEVKKMATICPISHRISFVPSEDEYRKAIEFEKNQIIAIWNDFICDNVANEIYEEDIDEYDITYDLDSFVKPYADAIGKAIKRKIIKKMENSSKPWANLGENHFNIQADHLIASESVDGHFEESDSMPNVLYLYGADYQVGADEDSAFVRCIRAAKKVEKIHPGSIKTIDIKNHDDGVDVKVIFE